MALRTKTILIISVTLAGLIATLFFVARFSLHRSFASVENDLSARFAEVERIETTKNIRQVIDIPRDIREQEERTLREVRAQGRGTLLTLVCCLTIGGVVLGSVILIILELLVLSRLGRLSSSAGRIGVSKDFSGRVPVEGRDEFGLLGGSMNAMLDSLAQTHHEIQKRTTEMRLLMNSVPVGLLSLDERLCINPEYSASAEAILECRGLAGREYAGLLGLSKEETRAAERETLLDFLDLFRKEALPEKEMAALNPLGTVHVSRGASARWVKPSYYLIRRGGEGGNHILVVIEDVTAAKELESEIIRSQEENLQLKAIVEEPELFREFMAEARTLLEKARETAKRLTPGEDCRRSIGDIFRTIHTIKGVAGAFALTQVSRPAGTLEDTLSVLLQGESITEGKTDSLREGLSALLNAFNDIQKHTSTIVGEDGADAASLSIRVSLNEVKRHIAEIKAMSLEGHFREKTALDATKHLIGRLVSLKMVPAAKGLGRATQIVPDLIRRLGKNAVFVFEGGDTSIDYEVAHELTTPLVHLFRNAVDHGLESPDERVKAQKPAQGEVKLSVRFDNGAIVLDIVDDGKGIDPQRLKEAAIAKKILTPEQARMLSIKQCYDLMLRPGFSTKSEVTEVSGRGVGLDAVVHSVKTNLKGDIQIESLPGKGSRFTLRVPATLEEN